MKTHQTHENSYNFTFFFIVFTFIFLFRARTSTKWGICEYLWAKLAEEAILALLQKLPIHFVICIYQKHVKKEMCRQQRFYRYIECCPLNR